MAHPMIGKSAKTGGPSPSTGPKAPRILDFDIEIEATAGDLTFYDTKEGMFGLRMASSMDVTKKTGGRITNAQGFIDDKAWGQASPWVDYVGPIKDQIVGIAILNHPPEFPIPHDLARPALRPICRQSVRLARFQYKIRQRRLHGARGPVDPIRLPRDPSRRRHRDDRDARAVPGVRQASRCRGSSRLTGSASGAEDRATGYADPIEGPIVGLDRQLADQLAAQAEGPAEGIGPEPRQQAVVMTGTAAQAITLLVERQPGHEDPVDRLGWDLGQVRAGSGIPSVPGLSSRWGSSIRCSRNTPAMRSTRGQITRFPA